MLETTTISVTGGIDTHGDTHTAAAVDHLGRLLGHQRFPATLRGYKDLLAWLTRWGTLALVGMEGTGSYGAGLARHLRAEGVRLVEVDRPDRRARRKHGKSDPVDAIAAARAAQAGVATGVPKTRDGVVEAIRAIRVARRSAIKARVAAGNSLKQMVVTAPAALREHLTGTSIEALVATCARLRPGDDLTDPYQATKVAMRRLARRHQLLGEEIAEADTDLAVLVQSVAPRLLERPGVGLQTASQLLVTAGDNPDRLRSDASFAALCGASPISASSGRTNRHRLNRGGDRDANCALHYVVLNRMKYHQPTKDYLTRRRTQGLSNREIMRCLKRYLVRELLPLIQEALSQPAQQAPLAA